MRFKDAMDILAASMGLPQVTPDEAGAFSLLFDDRFEVGFSPDGDDGTVVFHSEIGDAIELGEDGSRTLLEKCEQKLIAEAEDGDNEAFVTRVEDAIRNNPQHFPILSKYYL